MNTFQIFTILLTGLVSASPVDLSNSEDMSYGTASQNKNASTNLSKDLPKEYMSSKTELPDQTQKENLAYQEQSSIDATPGGYSPDGLGEMSELSNIENDNPEKSNGYEIKTDKRLDKIDNFDNIQQGYEGSELTQTLKKALDISIKADSENFIGESESPINSTPKFMEENDFNSGTKFENIDNSPGQDITYDNTQNGKKEYFETKKLGSPNEKTVKDQKNTTQEYNASY